jgi:hypothetical protein
MTSITGEANYFMYSAKSSENAVQLVGGWQIRTLVVSPAPHLSCVKYISAGGTCNSASVGVVQFRCANLAACKNGICCNAAAGSDGNCIQCGTDGRCSGCAFGFSLMNGTCLQICDGLALSGLPSRISFLGGKWQIFFFCFVLFWTSCTRLTCLLLLWI